MKCRACKRGGAKMRRNIALCPTCNRRLEAAIKSWRYSLERDIALLVAFDAYCASRENRAAIK